MSVSVQIVQYFVVPLYIVQFIICLRYAFRLTVFNLEINMANKTKKRSSSFSFMHVHFLLDSVYIRTSKHTHIYSSLRIEIPSEICIAKKIFNELTCI